MMKRKFLITAVSVLFVANLATAQIQDPLPFWNDGKSKQSIIDFVTKVTTQGSSAFVPPPERIATFDNDG
jgi:hypothetical protein